jgi:hypothetical protein
MSRLANAKSMYERNETMAAKNEIDTIRKYYADNVTVMKESVALLWKIQLKEAERNLAYCDSLLPTRQDEAAALAKAFILEKNEYSEVGAYILKQQTIERNVERSYIRCSVSEKGEISLASVYFGSLPINHTGIRISAGANLSVSAGPVPYDGGLNYRFNDMGNTSEIVNYTGASMDAIRFVCNNMKEKLKVEYTGGKPYTIYIDEPSKQAVKATWELSIVLSDVSALIKERDIALSRKAYLEEKLGRPAI